MITNHYTKKEFTSKGIYRIKNLLNGKSYVGCTTRSFGVRCKEHFNFLTTKTHWNKHLQSSWEKYGRERFEFLIEEVVDVIHIRELEEKEEDYIRKHDAVENGYNNSYSSNIGELNRIRVEKTPARKHIAIDPFGKIYRLNVLKTFCSDHGLQYSSMRNVRSGRCLHHKMWRCFYEEELPDQIEGPEEFRRIVETKNSESRTVASEKRRKTYRVFNPEGQEYITNNLSVFCKTHGLGYNSLRNVAQGRALHHKMWRCYHASKPYPSHDMFLKKYKDMKTKQFRMISEKNKCRTRGLTGKAEHHVAISPDGTVHDVPSLKKFCAIHDLSYNQMRKVRDEQALHSKMWRCYRSSELPENLETVEDFQACVEYARKHKLDAARKAHTGTYVVYDPEGKRYFVEHLISFCKENNLLYIDMTEIAKGKRHHHKQWRCYRVGTVHPTHEDFLKEHEVRKLKANLKRGKRNTCRLVSPEGEIFVTKNLKSFCREHGLVYSSMNSVVNGVKKSNKGWTGKILE